ncbi:short-chain dehydrogenase [Mesorhizobium sp. M7A.F.Ca.US.001.01.1.1]|nr:short-chain dehydrogenase [Mesorhizobium sp. M7A.F.Ca.US.001.01.1.1]
MVVKLDNIIVNDAVKVCRDSGLYSAVTFDKDAHQNYLDQFRDDNFQFDCHCVWCGRHSTFKTSRPSGHYHSWLHANNNGVLTGHFSAFLKCQRDLTHVYSYFFRIDGLSFIKIGQFPSLEDIASSDIQRFRPVLEPSYFADLHRAGGLFSHGIGVGAFVYLRRIFERLIARHHEDLSTPVDGFATMRMEEKIDALKGVLPAALVENKAAYGILSKGVHELDEETCRKHFPVVRAAIIAILEEDLQAREKKKAADELRKAIASAAGAVKG